MSASSHEDFHTDTKPVAFTVPFILALVTIVVMGLFLSLCDPSHDTHHAAPGQSEEGYRHSVGQNAGHSGETDAPPAHPATPAEGQH